MTEARRGAIFGLLAAASFGLSAPLAKRLLGDCTPQILAGLLYLGAGLAITIYRGLGSRSAETPLRRADLSRLVAIICAGGIAGPLFMLLGLRHTSGVTGSLLLNLEAPFTILVAVLAFGEHLGRHAAVAILLVLLGAALVGIRPAASSADGVGVLLLAAACAAWALDNNLTQKLSLRDPFALVQTKALTAGAFNLLMGLTLDHTALPNAKTVGLALLLGTVSYGLSVVLDAYALRLVGATREAAYFATAPFMGAVASLFIVGDRLRVFDGVTMLIMASGVVLLLRERHDHEHTHESMTHEHLHTHDDHHRHSHAADDAPGEPHAHIHTHVQLIHDHPHVSDLHHRHRH